MLSGGLITLALQLIVGATRPLVESPAVRALLEALEACSIGALDAQADLDILVGAIMEKYRGADHQHRLQLEAMGSLSPEQQKELSVIQRKIVQIFATVIARIRPDYFDRYPKQLYPVTMSLFGMLNWFYQWYRPQKGISREAYGELATQLLLGGLKGLKS